MENESNIIGQLGKTAGRLAGLIDGQIRTTEIKVGDLDELIQKAAAREHRRAAHNLRDARCYRVGSSFEPVGALDLDPTALAGWLTQVRTAAAARLVDRGDQAGAAPTLVLPVDQAEELFTAEAAGPAETFLQVLAGLVAALNTTEAGLTVAVTIRTDRYEVMQTHPALAEVDTGACQVFCVSRRLSDVGVGVFIGSVRCGLGRPGRVVRVPFSSW